jgi:hypothetical protein
MSAGLSPTGPQCPFEILWVAGVANILGIWNHQHLARTDVCGGSCLLAVNCSASRVVVATLWEVTLSQIAADGVSLFCSLVGAFFCQQQDHGISTTCGWRVSTLYSAVDLGYSSSIHGAAPAYMCACLSCMNPFFELQHVGSACTVGYFVGFPVTDSVRLAAHGYEGVGETEVGQWTAHVTVTEPVAPTAQVLLSRS